MKFDIEAAKKAGYSNEEIQNFLSQQSTKSFDAEKAKASGYSQEEINDFLKKSNISKTRSVISAPIKGIIKGAEQLTGSFDPSQIILSNLEKEPSLLKQLTEKVLPTKQETAEQLLERAGEIAPSAALGGNVLGTILGSLSGAVLGEIAKEEGIGPAGQGLAEAAGMSIPGLAKTAFKGATNLFKATPKSLPSGITEPRALGAKFAEKAIMSPSQQEKSIATLNKEASELTKKTIHKELPLSKKIEEGFNFENNFEKRFGELEKIAEKANPAIDLTPVSSFLSESTKKYRGIPKLHPEGSKVLAEVQAFQKRPQTEMKKLLRIYRSNNKKIRNIYETSRLTGKQAEYVDFLVDYNRNISKSFENTFPENSAWIKEFKDLNREYKQYKDSLKTLNILSSVLDQKATPSSISKLAEDAKLKNKLSLAMGDKGANEVVQIAKDLKLATEAIKKIPAKDLKWYEGYIPLSLLIPGGKAVTGTLAAKKSLDFARRGYGWFLSTPKRRAIYNDLLKSLISDNRSAYAKASQEMNKLLQEDQE